MLGVRDGLMFAEFHVAGCDDVQSPFTISI